MQRCPSIRHTVDGCMIPTLFRYHLSPFSSVKDNLPVGPKCHFFLIHNQVVLSLFRNARDVLTLSR